MTLGEYIKKYRKDHNDMSMDKFAELSGISKAYISLLEKNRHPKTGNPIEPSLEVYKKVSKVIGIPVLFLMDPPTEEERKKQEEIEIKLFGETGIIKNLSEYEKEVYKKNRAVRINVYGSVPAGVPLEAIQDIVDWEEIPADWENGGNKYIGLKIKGDSMEPKYIEGDTVIVKLQPDCENGQDCIVYVNGYDATLKKVVKKQDCIVLQPLNASKYEPKIYDYNDEENPVNILGVVVQIRRDV